MILYTLFENDVGMQHYYDDLDKFLKLSKTSNIYWSPKIDGARCWIKVDKRTIPHKGGFKKIAIIQYISRNNKSFDNLHVFDQDIIELCHHLNRVQSIKYPIIFDAEVASKNKTLSELMTQLRRQSNVDTKIFNLYIFDLAIPDIKFSRRQQMLKDAFSSNTKNIHLLEYKLLDNISDIENLKSQAIKNGYEGIMLISGDNVYQFGKRTRTGCKVKEFNTIDLKIIGINVGKESTKWSNKMSTFICNYKGKQIQISGRLDNKTREEFLNNPPIGQYAEIRYSEITKDGSLRHPSFIRLRPDKG